MPTNKVLEKAYGHIPKDIGINFEFPWIPTPRGVKYYWLILVRKFTR